MRSLAPIVLSLGSAIALALLTRAIARLGAGLSPARLNRLTEVALIAAAGLGLHWLLA